MSGSHKNFKHQHFWSLFKHQCWHCLRAPLTRGGPRLVRLLNFFLIRKKKKNLSTPLWGVRIRAPLTLAPQVGCLIFFFFVFSLIKKKIKNEPIRTATTCQWGLRNSTSMLNRAFLASFLPLLWWAPPLINSLSISIKDALMMLLQNWLFSFFFVNTRT